MRVRCLLTSLEGIWSSDIRRSAVARIDSISRLSAAGGSCVAG
jgi:hypothetical protein